MARTKKTPAASSTPALVATCVEKKSFPNGRAAYDYLTALEKTGQYSKVTCRRDNMYSFQHTVRAYKMLPDLDSTPRGECQICGRKQALDTKDRVYRHGYTRPGWGHIVGNCFGASYPTYQASSKRLARYVEMCENWVDGWQRTRSKAQRATAHAFNYKVVTKRGSFGQASEYEYKTWTATKKNFERSPIEASLYFSSWEQAHEQVVHAAKAALAAERECLKHFAARLAASPAGK